ncbi:hypothetical protein F5148DRAFT_1214215 [Russula earlei]|uniref:Uncharacterized protein n=1 Tax=Russula earlei TaxID=71964 RepID=A0ACC0U3Q6_9AGAM|nr:hypothetical protein F5148DRAFT_1214215 [Russula earlei]
MAVHPGMLANSWRRRLCLLLQGGGVFGFRYFVAFFCKFCVNIFGWARRRGGGWQKRKHDGVGRWVATEGQSIVEQAWSAGMSS